MLCKPLDTYCSHLQWFPDWLVHLCRRHLILLRNRPSVAQLDLFVGGLAAWLGFPFSLLHHRLLLYNHVKKPNGGFDWKILWRESGNIRIASWVLNVKRLKIAGKKSRSSVAHILSTICFKRTSNKRHMYGRLRDMSVKRLVLQPVAETSKITNNH